MYGGGTISCANTTHDYIAHQHDYLALFLLKSILICCGHCAKICWAYGD